MNQKTPACVKRPAGVFLRSGVQSRGKRKRRRAEAPRRSLFRDLELTTGFPHAPNSGARTVDSHSRFLKPNTTQVPNILFDELLPELSHAELKVLLYIIRRTFGFQRESDSISLSQMLNGLTKRNGEILDRGVGLSKKSLLQALKSLQEQGYIHTERQSNIEQGNLPSLYFLTLGVVSTPRGVEKVHQGLGVVTTPHNTKEGNQDGGNQDISSYFEGHPYVQTNFPIKEISREKKFSHNIEHYILLWSTEFHDEEHERSNVSQALNLWNDSQLGEEDFLFIMQQAKTITKSRANVKKAANGGYGLKNRMPLYFAVLRDILSKKGEWV